MGTYADHFTGEELQVKFLSDSGEDDSPLRHAKVTTTLDLYSQSIDAAKLETQEDIALAITSTAAAD